MKQLITMAFLATTFFSSADTSGIKFEKLTLEKAKEKAKTENKIIFIDFYADWCGPCKWLAKTVFTEEEVGTLFNENFINLKINADHDDFIGGAYDASSLPTLLFIDHDGNLKKKIVGAVDKETLISNANYVLHPDTDPIALNAKRFQKGDREKVFLFEYALQLSEAEKDMDEVIKAYKGTYPNLDLKDDIDFIFFYLESVDENGTALIALFLKDFKQFYKSEEQKDQALQKLVDIYIDKLEDAVEEKNSKKKDEIIEELVNFVKVNKIEEIESKKVADLFNSFYNEKVKNG